jgi:DNA end-binding protein Ku
VLALQTMFFADEVRDPRKDIGALQVAEGFADRELTIARQLIEAMITERRPEDYRDTYRDQVAGLIERKLRGRADRQRGRPAPRRPSWWT